jgi:glycyl-tRNA synthetase
VPAQAEQAPGQFEKCDLTEARQFNLMFKTFMGPVEDTASVVYMRPETAQGIFVNFDNVVTTARQKIPFGIAQIGKSFRNEITPGNFLFRTREFEQMEMEFFVKPGEDESWFEYWTQARLDWYVQLGIRRDNLRLRRTPTTSWRTMPRAAPTSSTTSRSAGRSWRGIANRTDFDLRRHSSSAARILRYFDEETREHYSRTSSSRPPVRTAPRSPSSSMPTTRTSSTARRAPSSACIRRSHR